MNRLHQKTILKFSALLLLNGLFFGFVDPTKGSSLTLFIGFFILALDIYLLTRLGVAVFQSLFNKPNLQKNKVSSTITVVALILLALQSIGQLSARDVVAVLLISVIVMFYTSIYGGRRKQ